MTVLVSNYPTDHREHKENFLKNFAPVSVWLLIYKAHYKRPLAHRVSHPQLSFRYQSLIDSEARMVGARQAAGRIRGWSRRIHMIVAVLFYGGLLTHIIVVLFFAGYAAGDSEIDWWYITAWGR